jgi:hypothetical protein
MLCPRTRRIGNPSHPNLKKFDLTGVYFRPQCLHRHWGVPAEVEPDLVPMPPQSGHGLQAGSQLIQSLNGQWIKMDGGGPVSHLKRLRGG